jgi:hypothetical protein
LEFPEEILVVTSVGQKWDGYNVVEHPPGLVPVGSPFSRKNRHIIVVVVVVVGGGGGGGGGGGIYLFIYLFIYLLFPHST